MKTLVSEVLEEWRQYASDKFGFKDDSDTLHLYYFPTSFFSQKAVIALRESRLPHRLTFVSPLSGDLASPWFLQLNPHGTVPVLRHGSVTLTGSDVIIDEIDALMEERGEAPRLVPPSDAPESPLVEEWRKRLAAVDMELITYGVMLHHELLTAGPSLPGWLVASRGVFIDTQDNTAVDPDEMKEWNPDLVKALDMKTHSSRDLSGSRYSIKDTRRALSQLEDIMDAIEAQLRTCRHVHSSEHWLCGPRFTAADISLCVLLARLDLLGHTSIMDVAKRPAVAQYWGQARRRESVRDTVDVIKHLKAYMLRRVVHRMARGLAAAALLVATGWAVRRRVMG